jgi:hypothetical protein
MLDHVLTTAMGAAFEQAKLANKPGVARKAGKAASEGGQAFEI